MAIWTPWQRRENPVESGPQDNLGFSRLRVLPWPIMRLCINIYMGMPVNSGAALTDARPCIAGQMARETALGLIGGESAAASGSDCATDRVMISLRTPPPTFSDKSASGNSSLLPAANTALREHHRHVPGRVAFWHLTTGLPVGRLVPAGRLHAADGSCPATANTAYRGRG